MNTHLLRRTIQYLLFSGHRNGHGIHSPFLYELISGDFKNNIDGGVVNTVEKYRKELLNNMNMIEVVDLGAGSLKLKGNKRRIRDIAATAAVRKHYGKLLSKLAMRCNGKAIIELGTSLGISTMYLALAADKSMVYTIEGCPGCAGIAGEGFREHNINNVKLFTGDFESVLPGLLKESGSPGLIFIDGNHRSGPLTTYVDYLLPFCSDGSIFILDDIHSSKDMEEAWNKLKERKVFSLSLDLLQFGILFFDSRFSKEHFMIRY